MANVIEEPFPSSRADSLVVRRVVHRVLHEARYRLLLARLRRLARLRDIELDLAPNEHRYRLSKGSVLLEPNVMNLRGLEDWLKTAAAPDPYEDTD